MKRKPFPTKNNNLNVIFFLLFLFSVITSFAYFVYTPNIGFLFELTLNQQNWQHILFYHLVVSLYGIAFLAFLVPTMRGRIGFWEASLTRKIGFTFIISLVVGSLLFTVAHSLVSMLSTAKTFAGGCEVEFHSGRRAPDTYSLHLKTENRQKTFTLSTWQTSQAVGPYVSLPPKREGRVPCQSLSLEVEYIGVLGKYFVIGL